MPITSEKFEQHVDIHEKVISFVSKFYKLQGYDVFREIKIGRYKTDLIIVRDQNLVISIEAKTSNISEIRKGVGQCLTYMDWSHLVYLAVPFDVINDSQSLLKYTPIGLISLVNEEVLIVKEAELKEPDKTKLYQVLQKTTGYCWLCGKTFNLIEPTWDGYTSPNPFIPVAFRDDDNKLIKQLEKFTGLKKNTKNYWVGVCKVCSRILGMAFQEYIHSICDDESPSVFDFGIVVKEHPRKITRKKLQKFIK